jgi:pantoate kinase
MASGSAFCPGHITAFFEICEHHEPMKKGSRGAGFCISSGVRTHVVAKDAKEQDIRIWINGMRKEADTTELVVRRMLGSRKVEIRLKSSSELPISQGFGMSGAGALSAALALDKALKLKLPRNKLVQIAHVAEVEAMTGLGDVYPQSLGGTDVRVRPGAPPHGKIIRKSGRKKFLLCILGKELKTKSVLSNPTARSRISRIGREYIEEYMVDPSWTRLLGLSSRFARDTNLATEKILETIEEVEANGGRAGMAMLGNSIFASGDERRLKRALSGFGKVHSCTIENSGARIIRQA